ncbi:hypothetical protein [Deinococcus cellulosilyticus]|uniref:Uncharacterized protein n=1 Tax=Deinococcus cellulosilyticus (strain DSM 18568 / NBRC 106333 / KACC 11606 / 5516J-15) TaxID=1223518 RepID=A0A511N9C2_DEIC1|nr:hypothetical protein [Deinococcus cellulosilyticus]GEM49116.1 hypothetical protein DC3_47510 [Deinococcus cellulosilyticus NBRC 106333 = KACC 11606]
MSNDPQPEIPAFEFRPPEVDRDRKFSFLHPSIPAVGVMSLAAAGLHGGVTGAHFEEWVGYGIFFLVSTILQAFWGALALIKFWESKEALNDPYPRAGVVTWEAAFYQAGAWGNFAIAVLYVITRIWGVPFAGPALGEKEAWDFYGIATTILEFLIFAQGLKMAGDLKRGEVPMSLNDLHREG